MLTKYFCSVCHEDFGDEIMGLMCGHMFHRACLQDWQRRSRTCPECRRLIFNTPIRIHFQSREIDERTLPIVAELTGKLEENVLKLSQVEEILEDIEDENNYLQTMEQSLRKELSLKNTETSKFNQARKSFRRELDLKNTEIGKLKQDLRMLGENTPTKREVITKNERKKHSKELAERDKQIQSLEKELRAQSLELETTRKIANILFEDIKLLDRYLLSNLNRSQHEHFPERGNTNTDSITLHDRKIHTTPVPPQIAKLLEFLYLKVVLRVIHDCIMC